MNTTFYEWLTNEMKKRGWSQAELARRANLSRSAVSYILRGTRKPGPLTVQAIAVALDLPEDQVYERAGLLNEVRYDSLFLGEVNHLLAQLPLSDQEEIVEIMRLKLRLKHGNNSSQNHGRGMGESK